MKNIFRRKAFAQLTGETQKLPDRYSPTVLKTGLGFGLAWLMKQLNYQVFEIANTNSMLPVFDYNHLLYCEKLKPSVKLNQHDICIYEDAPTGRLIVHRIVSVDQKNQRYKFQGDNNLFADGWIPRKNIKWRVAVVSYAR